MNTVTGRIVNKESGLGIPDLLISVFDIDPQTTPDVIARVNTTVQLQADRIGSVLTGPDGHFSLAFDDSAFQNEGDEKRPDLALTVEGPEERGVTPCPPLLHVSCGIRLNAGRNETFIVRIANEQLKQAGITPPSIAQKPSMEASDVIQRITAASQQKLELDSGIRSIVAQKIKTKREIAKKFETDIKAKVIQSISSVPVSLRNSDQLVNPGDSVELKYLDTIKKQLTRIFNRSTAKEPMSMRGVVSLSEANKVQLDRFKDSNGNYVNIPGDDFDALFTNNDEGNTIVPTTVMLKSDPIEQLCREQTTDRSCAEEILGINLGSNGNGTRGGTHGSGTGSDGDGTGTGGGGGTTGGPPAENAPATPQDIPKYIAELLTTTTPPEYPPTFVFPTNNDGEPLEGQGANHQKISAGIVNAFELQKSPADVPSFHDFHHLKIAFEPVWQEAIDQEIIGLTKSAYQHIVKISNDPFVDAPDQEDPVETLLWACRDLEEILEDEPPSEVIESFNVSTEQWNALKAEHQAKLSQLVDDLKVIQTKADRFVEETREREKKLADRIVSAGLMDSLGQEFKFKKELEELQKRFWATFRQYRAELQSVKDQAENILANADKKIENNSHDIGKLCHLIEELKKRLNERYPFTVYAANSQERSVNFGLMVTYRQKWDPQTYQAGELVKTITLAPKEVRKFTRKTVIKEKRSVKEVKKSLESRRDDSSETSRTEAEILRRANRKTNFNLTTEGSFNVAYASGKVTSSLTTDAQVESRDVKKDFRDAVYKSAQEYKQERSIDVNTEESFEEEFTESGEISNPNDEIPVTFLFYELQRRYRVYEQIHKLVPVVLVAREVPNPADIDNDWLVAHDWILRRVLLDNSFAPALSYLSSRITGDEAALKVMKENLKRHRRLAEELKDQLLASQAQVARRYEALEAAIDRQAGLASDDGGFFDPFFGPVKSLAISDDILNSTADVLLDGGDDGTPEEARIRREAAKDAFERAAREEKDLRARLEREVTVLNQTTEAYTKTLSEHLNQQTQIMRLRVHVKQNILYYMQAIWEHEPSGQRFFRLHKTKIPTLSGKRTINISGAALEMSTALPGTDTTPHPFETKVEMDSDFESVTLAEVADLDNPLGYKGNYMIFPLTQHNALTQFMASPYADNVLGLRDPDEMGNWTLHDFAKYVCCLKEHLGEEEFKRHHKTLKSQYLRLMHEPRPNNEDLIVPTDSLFIEALPGTHAILENFKLMHRAIDVKKAQAETREIELENLRYAARLLNNKFNDPDIEKNIVVEGGASVVVGDQ